MQSNFVKLVFIAAASCAFSTSLHAQQLLVEGGALSTDYYLLKDVLTGAGLEVSIARKESRYAIHFGAERYTGHSTRTGMPCVGHVEPGTCYTPELLRDDATLILVALGGSAEVLRRGNTALGIVGFVNGGRVRSATQSLQSRAKYGGSGSEWGGSVALRGTWTPFKQVPFVVEARSTIGMLDGFFNPEDSDGYNIFLDPILYGRLTLGVSYKLPLKMHDLTPKPPKTSNK